ncbi:hypothetical protein SAMN05192534_10316 [Alteribacillus persepolensis]|uniref:Uncharacterized protein n=1 Tax=Alteribacillus persepolensis TaxID=568899 RepID=A0A1G8ATJ9_9BACI|nr:hypothetical protein [Alteribacillus persepolensis]SDH24382.1 hypothetical protein SAMN05192534_10316 [Alteribacillus persepolensis]
MTTAVELPKYQELSDKELMDWTPKEFTENIIRKSEMFGEAFFDKEHWKTVELDEETRQKNLIEFCARLAWREFYNGVHPPSKQIVMLEQGDDDIGIRIRLAQQIIDEVKHQRIWGSWCKHYGGSPKLQDYDVSPEVIKQFRLTNEYEDIAEIALNLQLTGEVILVFLFGYGTLKPENSITRQLLPDELVKGIEKEVVNDEPRHIAVGRDIMKKYCGDAKKRRHLLELQQAKLENTIKIMSRDLDLLGAERTGPLPSV